MADVDDLRRMALALPETTEGTHFHLASFQVRGRNFGVIEKDGHLLLSVEPTQVPALIAEDPDAFGEVRRFDRLIGLRADPAKLPEQRLAQVVELAWRHKAPKKLVAAKDAQAGGQR